MKTRVFLLNVLLILLYLSVSAQRRKEVVSPSTPFDKALTQSALARGNSTLRGVIQLKVENRANTLLGIEVSLFPCTPYFNEWLELSKNNKKGKKIVAISNEALTYRILAKVSDKDGTFEFKNLKPGRYYLQSEVTQGNSKNFRFKVGQNTTTGYNIYGQAISQYTQDIYQTKRMDYNVTHVVSTIAEITSDGQIVNFEL